MTGVAFRPLAVLLSRCWLLLAPLLLFASLHHAVEANVWRWRRSVELVAGRPLFPEIEQPSFDNSTPTDVTAQQGQTVYLHCIVTNLGEKVVSWIRRRDFAVLTVGLATYTADERFQAVHLERSEDWMLQVKRTQPNDAGEYECQINMHPLISYFVRLIVLVPRARILEAPELFIKSGSSMNVSCAIENSPEPPVFVFWFHNERVINYDGPGHISGAKKEPDAYVSNLYIRNARPQDSGNYTCGPSNAGSTSVVVHVLNGEKRAAMQHELSRASRREPWLLVAIVWTLAFS
ncbi:zwei Ig domain protein zig-8-like [Ornithodoros turicata]|uniref:zwei Ig domain protein zig-8-like n=1 Tax=Ornithodoros turicata TaxID=34597 RepID=UPI003138C784